MYILLLTETTHRWNDDRYKKGKRTMVCKYIWQVKTKFCIHLKKKLMISTSRRGNRKRSNENDWENMKIYQLFSASSVQAGTIIHVSTSVHLCIFISDQSSPSCPALNFHTLFLSNEIGTLCNRKSFYVFESVKSKSMALQYKKQKTERK